MATVTAYDARGRGIKMSAGSLDTSTSSTNTELVSSSYLGGNEYLYVVSVSDEDQLDAFSFQTYDSSGTEYLTRIIYSNNGSTILKLEDMFLSPTDFLDGASVWLRYDDVLSGNKYADKLMGFTGSDILYGNAGKDTLYGGNGADTLYGGAGDDTLSGGAGNDAMYGGEGNDVFLLNGGDSIAGGAGYDVMYLSGGSTNASFSFEGIEEIHASDSGLSVRWTSGNMLLYGGSSVDDVAAGSGRDTVYGGGGKDYLHGGAGGDILAGGAGADELQGGAGKDVLYGGNGADTFVFTATRQSSATATSADVIKDFIRGTDTIDLSAIDASTKLSGNNTFTFDGTTSFGTSKQGDIYYKKFDLSGTSKDYTMVYIDTDNDSAAEMTIKLMGLHNLTASDFVL